MVAYKIKNKDGLFSKGGMTPQFTKRGKTWGSFGAIKLHLRQFCSEYTRDENFNYTKQWQNNIPEDWIVMELSLRGVREFSAKELYKETEE